MRFRNFQTRAGIAVTGVVGPITTRAIRERLPEFVGPGNSYAGYGRTPVANRPLTNPAQSRWLNSSPTVSSASSATQNIPTTNNSGLGFNPGAFWGTDAAAGHIGDGLELASIFAGTRGAAGGLSRAGTAMGFVGMGLDVGTGIWDNVQAGAPTAHIVSDAGVDTIFSLGGLGAAALGGAKVGGATGAKIGTAIAPGPGTAIGGKIGGWLGGIGAGWAYTAATDGFTYNGRSLRDWTRGLFRH